MDSSSPATSNIVTYSETQRVQKITWQQTMLRIKDPKKTIPFYVNNFGFHHLHTYDFPQWSVSQRLGSLGFIHDMHGNIGDSHFTS
jgi:hypothetical protein